MAPQKSVGESLGRSIQDFGKRGYAALVGDENAYRYGEINERKARLAKETKTWFDQYGVTKRYISGYRWKTKIFAVSVALLLLHTFFSYMSPSSIEPDNAYEGYWMVILFATLFGAWYWATILAPDAGEAIKKIAGKANTATNKSSPPPKDDDE